MALQSESDFELPTVDFNNEDLKPGTPEWHSVKNQVMQALQRHGAFKASYNKVPSELSDDLFSGLQELFDLPIETKRRISCKRVSNSYIKFPVCESMGIEDADILEIAQSFTNTLWPEGMNSKFSGTFNFYAKRVAELDEMVRRMVLESLGVENHLEEHLESTFRTLRVSKYDAPNSDEPIVAFDSHTDESIVSVLHQNNVGGLEIQTKDGQWHSVNFSPQPIVVMAGDIFLAWTNGRIHAPHHRITIRGHKDRYSTVMFATPKVGCEVKTLEELVDDEHPHLYKAFDYDKYLEFICTDEALAATSPLKLFCGV